MNSRRWNAAAIVVSIGMAIFIATMNRLNRTERESASALEAPSRSDGENANNPVESLLPAGETSRVAETPPVNPATPAKTPKAQNRLSIVVNLPGGGVPTALRIGIGSGEKPLYNAPFGDFAYLSDRFDNATWLGNSQGSDGSISTSFELPRSGELNLRAIVAATPLRVQVLAPFDIVLHDEQVGALGETETRVVNVQLKSTPHQLAGTVSDENGRAIVGAKLRISTTELDWNGGDIMGVVETLSDASGKYHFDALYMNRIGVELTCAGFVAKWIDAIDIGPATKLDIRMQMGVRVTVRVLDTDGVPIDAKIMWATFEEGRHTAHAKQIQPGVFEFTDLPPSNVILAVNVGGKLYEQSHDALQPEATISVPVLGRLEVSWNLPAEFDLTNAGVGVRMKGEETTTVQKPLLERVGTLTFDVTPGDYEAGIERGGRGRARISLSKFVPIVVQPRVNVRVAIEL